MKLSALIKLLQENEIADTDPEVFIDLDLGEFGNHVLYPKDIFEDNDKLYLTIKVSQE